jgi:hypothetical protein
MTKRTLGPGMMTSRNDARAKAAKACSGGIAGP